MSNLINLKIESQYEMGQVIAFVDFLLKKGFKIIRDTSCSLGLDGDFKVCIDYDSRDAYLSIKIAPSVNAQSYVSTQFRAGTVLQYLVPDFKMTDDEGAMIVNNYDLIFAFLDNRLGRKSGFESFQTWTLQRFQ